MTHAEVCVVGCQRRGRAGAARRAGRPGRRRPGPASRRGKPSQPERGTSALAGRALIVVENLSVPFDRRVWQEAIALRDAGWRVDVICPQGETQDTEAYESNCDGVGSTAIRSRAAVGGPRGFLQEYGAALWHSVRLARRIGPVDVVHIVQPAGPAVPRGEGRARRGRAVAVRPARPRPGAVPVPVRPGRGPALPAPCACMERLTYRAADVVIATNESYRDGGAAEAAQGSPGRVRGAQRPGRRALPRRRAGSGAAARRAAPAVLPRRDGSAGRRGLRAAGARVAARRRRAHRLARRVRRCRGRVRRHGGALPGARPDRPGHVHRPDPGRGPAAATCRRRTSAWRRTR